MRVKYLSFEELPLLIGGSVLKKDIKSQNRKYLIAYVILNWMLFGWFSNLLVIDVAGWKNILEKVMNPTHIMGVLLIPFCIIIEAIISSEIKHKFIFLKFHNPLPGCRAFTEIAPKDDRIDMEKLKKLFPTGIPTDEREQNSTWYGFYKKHSEDLSVYHAQRSFLLTRDMAILTYLFLPTSIIAHTIWGTYLSKILMHVILLLAILIFTVIASQNYGKRFVANVIAEELNPKSI